MLDLFDNPELFALPVGLAGMYIVYRLACHFNDRMYNIALNHMNSMTDSIRELAASIADLREWLKENMGKDA